MSTLNVFTVRDLRERTGELIRDAEQGRVALVTKHGRPTLLTIPFDERLLNHGVHRALALKLFEEGYAGLAGAAKIAGVSSEEFLDLLAQSGIDAVSHPAEDLAKEAEAAS